MHEIPALMGRLRGPKLILRYVFRSAYKEVSHTEIRELLRERWNHYNGIVHCLYVATTADTATYCCGVIHQGSGEYKPAKFDIRNWHNVQIQGCEPQAAWHAQADDLSHSCYRALGTLNPNAPGPEIDASSYCFLSLVENGIDLVPKLAAQDHTTQTEASLFSHPVISPMLSIGTVQHIMQNIAAVSGFHNEDAMCLVKEFLLSPSKREQPVSSAFIHVVRQSGIQFPTTYRSGTPIIFLEEDYVTGAKIPAWKYWEEAQQSALAGDGSIYERDARYVETELNRAGRKALIQKIMYEVKDNSTNPGQNNHAIINIPLRSLDARLPTVIAAEHYMHPEVAELNNEMNLVPRRFTFDLHIDFGQIAFSVMSGDGVKIWCLFPPSSSNLEVFYPQSSLDAKFVRLCSTLQDGMVIVQTRGQAVYIPSGWLHVTHTLRGAELYGFTLSSAADLDIIAAVLEWEWTARKMEADPEVGTEEEPLISALFSACVPSNGNGETPLKYREQAMRQWCVFGKRILSRMSQRQADTRVLRFMAVLSLLSTCPRCGSSPKDHEQIRHGRKRKARN